MMWHADSLHSLLYLFLQRHYEMVTHSTYKFDHYLEAMLLPLLGNPVCERNLGTYGVPTNDVSASIVCFPLQPKPHQVGDAWVLEHWGEGAPLPLSTQPQSPSSSPSPHPHQSPHPHSLHSHSLQSPWFPLSREEVD
ncbi:hypothetical protein B484DRAFT_440599 [Ochromonadaceae sp. CCMP2298]|nr:hypothetical protein B484DRAFT_440599 [Ochromonadaceae sp. CCMP2298]